MENEKSIIDILSESASLVLAAVHLQEALEQFCKDNPSVKYSDLFNFVVKVRDILDEI